MKQLVEKTFWNLRLFAPRLYFTPSKYFPAQATFYYILAVGWFCKLFKRCRHLTLFHVPCFINLKSDLSLYWIARDRNKLVIGKIAFRFARITRKSNKRPQNIILGRTLKREFPIKVLHWNRIWSIHFNFAFLKIIFYIFREIISIN